MLINKNNQGAGREKEISSLPNVVRNVYRPYFVQDPNTFHEENNGLMQYDKSLRYPFHISISGLLETSLNPTGSTNKKKKM